MTVYLSRRYSFTAAHRLHAPQLSDAENRAIYGKCNNPFGHGHDYQVEITVAGQVDPVTGRAVSLDALDALARREAVEPFRYRNLNEEVAAFRAAVPTTENLAAEVDRRLRQAWKEAFPDGSPRLEKIRIWETPRNICEIGGN
ncbi:MAG TPA: 6-carboxytetrahydropterin synthase [Bryobacteraceae bacterium]|jgi:6-pyruvoyltetrahydropterin/6-carboxytetrahydropterin synthase|nr:6-carboxytetrahydropterin synthase [Bryobacteraceae bacterium]